jgi:hypothetical protein
MADNVLREAYTTFLAQKASYERASLQLWTASAALSLLRQEAMNGTHLRGKLLEQLSVKLLWFSPYL